MRGSERERERGGGVREREREREQGREELLNWLVYTCMYNTHIYIIHYMYM